ncbi:MAG: adenylosuccinate synthase [Candidatus Methylomirabilaceae bacterium]
MANVIVVGTQWGDEGKGKVVDLLSEHFDAVARYQGGTNAGHTVVVGEEKIVLHLVPSGVLRKGKICILGNGVVIDLPALLEEIDQLVRLQVKVEENLFISKNAHLVLPYHKLLDAELERLRGGRRIGTTRRGIGPAYVDKMARTGIRIGDLVDPALFRERLRANLEEKQAQFPHHQELRELDAEKVAAEQLEQFERARAFLVDSSFVIHNLVRADKSILFEGAQGTLLDIDLGTYPYVTSSSATAGGACTGTGVSPLAIHGILGVTKAYTTRVGEGPFPTELIDAMGEGLRERGQEFGATTGRPRRCGWFDAVAVRYSARVNGLSALALMKLDVLDACDWIRICTGYRRRGEVYQDFPNETGLLKECEPIYEEVPGWNESIVGTTSFDRLPARCRAYVERLEALTGVEAGLISTGPRRDQTILRATPAMRAWELAR